MVVQPCVGQRKAVSCSYPSPPPSLTVRRQQCIEALQTGLIDYDGAARPSPAFSLPPFPHLSLLPSLSPSLASPSLLSPPPPHSPLDPIDPPHWRRRRRRRPAPSSKLRLASSPARPVWGRRRCQRRRRQCHRHRCRRRQCRRAESGRGVNRRGATSSGPPALSSPPPGLPPPPAGRPAAGFASWTRRS